MMDHGHDNQQPSQQHMHSSKRNNLNRHNWVSTQMYGVTGDSSDQNREVTFLGSWYLSWFLLEGLLHQANLTEKKTSDNMLEVFLSNRIPQSKTVSAALEGRWDNFLKS